MPDCIPEQDEKLLLIRMPHMLSTIRNLETQGELRNPALCWTLHCLTLFAII
jgi:hypothetical protein